MNTVNLGVVSPIHRGLHDASVAYNRLSFVSDAQRSFYISKIAVPVDTELTDPIYWDKLMDGEELNLKDTLLSSVINASAVLGAEISTLSSKQRELRGRLESIYTELFINKDTFISMLDSVSSSETRIDESHTVSWQVYEAMAEYIRLEKNSGLMSSREVGGDLENPEYKHNVDNTGRSIMMHNHANYKAMSGTGILSFNANGYVGKSRHNDYRLEMPADQGGAFVTEPSLSPPHPPSVNGNPDDQVILMQELFKRYKDKTLLEVEKQSFTWEMAYIEVWWEEIEFDTNVVDTFASFRHSVPTATALDLQLEYQALAQGGKKSRFENILNAPFVYKLDENGTKVLCLLRHRLITKKMDTLDGKTWDEILTYDPDEVIDAKFNFRDNIDNLSATFNMKDIDDYIATIPGVGGVTEIIEDSLTPDGYVIQSPLNTAKYHRKYSVEDDAMGIRNFITGWNDPTLFTADTKTPNIHRGVSYLLPLEMVLRTPLENWNPYELKYSATAGGTGDMVEDPYDGISDNGRYLMTPDSFFDEEYTPTEADTRTHAWIKDPLDIARHVVASGIWWKTRSIGGGVGELRIRHAMYFAADKYSPSNIRLKAVQFREQVNEINSTAILGDLILKNSTKINKIQG